MRDVPAPRTSAPMARRRAARSPTSGSFAAFSITVVPLASAAAISRLSVAVWLGYSSTTRVPDQPAVRHAAAHLAVGGLEHRAHGLEPVDVEVDRPVAEVVAARQRHAHGAAARHQQPEHDDRGAHALDELVGRLRYQLVGGRRGDGHLAAAQEIDPRPECAQHLGHGGHVGDVGYVRQHRAPFRQQAGHHQLER